MKHKVSELEGALLDAAVANALLPTAMRLFPRSQWREGYEPPPQLGYSTDWSAGGPIIERENLAIYRQEYSDGTLREWCASQSLGLWDDSPHQGKGTTPLIAAMRAFVVSKFGDEVELP